jgi:hypothetical protein
MIRSESSVIARLWFTLGDEQASPIPGNRISLGSRQIPTEKV